MQDSDSTVQGHSPRSIVIRELRREIQEGVIRVGEPVPSERALTERFGVARNTVRAALDQLTSEGWLSARVGSGRHNRVVRARSTPIGVTLARDTVVILGRSRLEMDATHRHAGWSDFVGLGAQQAIEDRGLHLLVFNPAKIATHAPALVEQRAFGVLVPAGLPDDAARDCVNRMAEAGIAVVVFGEELQGERLDRVLSDHEQGAYELTRWLLGRGCRRPRMVWCSEARHAWATARRAGHERAMAEAGLVAAPPIQTLAFATPEGSTTAREAYEIRARYLAGYLAPALLGADPADAILAPTDGDALVLAGACERLGRAPNRDVCITGYDNYWEDCAEREFAPCGPAATVDKQNPVIGSEMVRLLLERASAEPSRPAMVCRIPQRLVPVVGTEGG